MVWEGADSVQWYNTRRLLALIGSIPLAEAAAAFCAQVSGCAKAA